jgi:hypothetical protein
MRSGALVLLTLLGYMGCTAEESSNPVRDAFAASQHEAGFGDAVLFRFSTSGGTRPTVLRLPTLDVGPLPLESQPRDLREVVGFVGDRGVVYVITTDDELAAFDLTTGRFRVVDSSVVAGTIGPTGTPFVVHADGSVATIGLKSVTPWPVGFDSVPTELYGAVRERLIAVMPGDSARRLVLAANGQPVVEQPVPDGTVHVSAWGDAVLIATDAGIVMLDPADPDDGTIFPLESAPHDADFSASGHRIHVVGQDGTLRSVDRFSGEVVREMPLGAVPRVWRTDPWGRYLLLQGDAGTPVRAFDAVTLALVDSIDGDWDDQLPRSAPDGSVLVRQADRIAAWTPGAADPVATIEAPAASLWLVAPWDAAQPVQTIVDEGTPEPATPGQTLFVQVSTTTNADWAADLAANLRRAGMPATVLAPEQAPDPYRVVLGPYATREEAEATGRELRLPFWIFAQDSSTMEP